MGVSSSQPLVSIITVVYNGAAFLEETIQSVLGQSYENKEYIIIDGGSTDGTVDIIKRYADQLAYWVSEPDKGMYDAINKGILQARGELWTSLNADDRMVDSSVVERVVSTYLKDTSGAGAYFGNIIKEKNGIRRHIRLFDLDHGVLHASGHCTFMPQPATFVRKSSSDKIGLFDTTYRYASDYDYHLRLTAAVPVAHIDFPLTIFRQHDEALTHTGAEKMNSERLQILSNYEGAGSGLKSMIVKYWGWGRYLLKNRVFAEKTTVV